MACSARYLFIICVLSGVHSTPTSARPKNWGLHWPHTASRILLIHPRHAAPFSTHMVCAGSGAGVLSSPALHTPMFTARAGFWGAAGLRPHWRITASGSPQPPRRGYRPPTLGGAWHCRGARSPPVILWRTLRGHAGVCLLVAVPATVAARPRVPRQ